MTNIRTGALTQMLLSHYHTNEEDTTNKYIATTQVRSEGTYAERTADAIIIGNWPSSGYEVEGFEVKVSRADWLNEVKNPNKSEPIKRYCHRWWLVISNESFVKEGELPDDWGMKVVNHGRLQTIKKAPLLSPEPMSVPFVTSLLRADKRGEIPIDVHEEKMKDAVRDAEAAMKLKYKTLMDYVKFLNSGMGIDLKYDKQRDYNNYGSYTYEWISQIKNHGTFSTPDDLLRYVKTALNGDFEKLDHYLKWAKGYTQDAINIIDKAQDKKMGKE